MNYTPYYAYAAARTRKYKLYLIACEYLQIDPSWEYSIDFIYGRADYAISLWNKNEAGCIEFKEKVLWLAFNYEKCAGWYGFVKKSQKAVDKGRLIIHPRTISRGYYKRPLSQINYDFYAKEQNKIGCIAFIIMIPIIVLFTIIMLLF